MCKFPLLFLSFHLFFLKRGSEGRSTLAQSWSRFPPIKREFFFFPLLLGWGSDPRNIDACFEIIPSSSGENMPVVQESLLFLALKAAAQENENDRGNRERFLRWAQTAEVSFHPSALRNDTAHWQIYVLIRMRITSGKLKHCCLSTGTPNLHAKRNNYDRRQAQIVSKDIFTA